MEPIKRRIAHWVEGRSGAELAAHAAGLVVIAVVPGAFAAWLAYRLIRARVG